LASKLFIKIKKIKNKIIKNKTLRSLEFWEFQGECIVILQIIVVVVVVVVDLAVFSLRRFRASAEKEFIFVLQLREEATFIFVLQRNRY